jgi:hypothetical protein
MQLQLRPSAPRFHPLMRPMYRRAGFAGLGLTPGYTPAQQAMADAFAAQFEAPPAVYQAPAQSAPPACSSGPANTADSPECIAALLAWQQQQMAAGSAANYAVDRANCETAWAENNARYIAAGVAPPPNDCAQRTYGLTLPNSSGGTNILTPQAQAIFDPNYTGPGSTPASAPAPTVTPVSLKFTNLTSGNNSKLAVGDRWQIQISNAARNAPVSVTGGQNGAHDTTPMGSSDSSGNWTSNGQITADQIGSWTEAWTVGGQPVGNFAFTVVPASAPGTTPSTSTTPATGGTVTGSFLDLLSKTTVIGGTSIPDWALVGAVLTVGYLLFMRGK